MCAKGTPARTRLFCSCSHALLAGTVVALALAVVFVWTHLLLVAGMAGLVVAGTAAAVRLLMRRTLVYVHQPAPEPEPELPDVVAAAEEIARNAADLERR